MHLPYSALVITHNRDDHLVNTMNGLLAQTVLPAEIVVVFMNQTDEPSLPASDVITTVHIERESKLPLALARNTAAAVAANELLIFLDVDCIPANDFAEQLIADHEKYGGLVMGTPRYLSAQWSISSDLWSQSSTHPARSGLRPGVCKDFNRFWSLCFAIGAGDFASVGGFDERFKGYGGEDTDFGWTLRDAGIPFALSDATAFHQYHQSLRPPLQHFEDVIDNAQTFYNKWKQWPMHRWLEQFEEIGLIDWQQQGDSVEVRRRPSEQELNSARSSDLFA